MLLEQAEQAEQADPGLGAATRAETLAAEQREKLAELRVEAPQAEESDEALLAGALASLTEQDLADAEPLSPYESGTELKLRQKAMVSSSSEVAARSGSAEMASSM